MNETVVQENVVEEQVITCRHHWVIAAPEGATSMGRCKRCGEVKEFRNSSGDMMWERDGGGGGSSWNGPIASKPAESATAGADEGY